VAVAAFYQTTVIGWNGDTRQLALWLAEQHVATSPTSHRWPDILDQAVAITVDPFPWEQAIPQRCHHNVRALIGMKGGEFVFGWALSYSGPLLVSSRNRAPLFRRWINHVVWRDPSGKLREVTPHFEAADRARIVWQPTTFIVDNSAAFQGIHPHSARYTSLRPEGKLVAHLLNCAQCADSDDLRLHWLRMAFAAIEPHGFVPKECRVESIGSRTSGIWLVAE
jgi:hypothetical protein